MSSAKSGTYHFLHIYHNSSAEAGWRHGPTLPIVVSDVHSWNSRASLEGLISGDDDRSPFDFGPEALKQINQIRMMEGITRVFNTEIFIYILIYIEGQLFETQFHK